MSSPDYWSAVWEQGDPLSSVEIFGRAEAQAYETFRDIVSRDGCGCHRPPAQEHPDFPDHKVYEDIYSPVKVCSDPLGNTGEWLLYMKERRVVPPGPNQPNGDSPIEAQQTVVVVQRVGMEDFLVGTYQRPRLHTRRPRVERIVTLADPFSLMETGLDAELNTQTEYMQWLDVARASLTQRQV